MTEHRAAFKVDYRRLRRVYIASLVACVVFGAFAVYHRAQYDTFGWEFGNLLGVPTLQAKTSRPDIQFHLACMNDRWRTIVSFPEPENRYSSPILFPEETEHVLVFDGRSSGNPRLITPTRINFQEKTIEWSEMGSAKGVVAAFRESGEIRIEVYVSGSDDDSTERHTSFLAYSSGMDAAIRRANTTCQVP